ncbi:MAG TPA: serine/threonine protein kinase [Herpetosiphon sp.]|uniref:non-specific serine/threonine protein kinase n=1 Tax=Herpetosiphon aurantiacus (strain ATCC 23779 / DSM 785 / 114-95) TaxID=316274 RepID=A9B3Y5_HERA2|nr:serine/threonine-protein kinase [Herpetosiphon sp.]ABX06121.1 serine/threonine protein kinase [Herpetosiphon aurantiacus DSM 785]HBW50102.1 serine/threonine protein kinase [Herpetosiphon sp.]
MNNSAHPQFNHQPMGMYAQQQFGEYQVRHKIGAGGMAEVYQADHPSFQTVALKLLNPLAINDPDMLQRFFQEANTVSQLHHPHIVAIYETAQTWYAPIQQWIPFIAMQYIDGGTLTERLQRQPKQDLAATLDMGRQIGSALDYAHGKHFIHRDIKPSNILFRGNGEAVLADFGIALARNQARITRTGGFVGTIAYTAPEVFDGITPDARADIYALGLILYEALAGNHPYWHETDSHEGVTIRKIQHTPLPPLREFAQFVSPGIADVITRAVMRDPDERFASMADFLEALEKARFPRSNSRANVPVPSHATLMQAPSRPNMGFGNSATNERHIKTVIQPEFKQPARTMPNAQPIGAVNSNVNQPLPASPSASPTWYGPAKPPAWQKLFDDKRWQVAAGVVVLGLIFWLGSTFFGNNSANADGDTPSTSVAMASTVPEPLATATVSVQAIETSTPTVDPLETKRLEYALGQEAYDRQDWPLAAQAFNRVWELEPTYLELESIGSATYFNWALGALNSPEAVAISQQYLAEAFRFDPNHALAKRLNNLLNSYQAGQQALSDGKTEASIEQLRQTLEQINSAQEFNGLRSELGVIEKLYQAYLLEARTAVEARDLAAAREAYRQAIELKDQDVNLDVSEAQAGLRAISPTPTPVPTARPQPTVARTPERLYFQKYAENAVDPTCFAVHVRGANTGGWFVTVDGLGNRGNLDGAGNTNVCGLIASQQVTFTVYNGSGQAVLGGSGIPTRGGDLMIGYWQ